MDGSSLRSGGSGGEAGSGRGLGEISLGRSLVASFFANRLLGELSRLHSSASRANLVHVRAMSSRMSRTRALGARSASFWQSYERFLNIAGVSTVSPPQRRSRNGKREGVAAGRLLFGTRTRNTELGSSHSAAGAPLVSLSQSPVPSNGPWLLRAQGAQQERPSPAIGAFEHALRLMHFISGSPRTQGPRPAPPRPLGNGLVGRRHKRYVDGNSLIGLCGATVRPAPGADRSAQGDASQHPAQEPARRASERAPRAPDGQCASNASRSSWLSFDSAK
jgi:hypothetical protein